MSIAHEDDVEWVSTERGTVFENRRRGLAAAAGGSKLGCTLTEVPPGKTAWPFHAHLGNEEAIYVLEGHATLRLGDRRHALKPGDYVALPARADAAHQIINTSEAPVRYLVMSTKNATDVVVFPDSKKHGIFAGGPAGSGFDRLTAFVPTDASVDYWDDEPCGDAEAVAEAAAAEQEAEIEELVDDELEAMKKRLNLED
ncbi:MAG: cupin domain-containing protein [Nannocystales bacterium]